MGLQSHPVLINTRFIYHIYVSEYSEHLLKTDYKNLHRTSHPPVTMQARWKYVRMSSDSDVMLTKIHEEN